jgi:hypothetical protein
MQKILEIVNANFIELFKKKLKLKLLTKIEVN